jgi:hypothetical protein
MRSAVAAAMNTGMAPESVTVKEIAMRTAPATAGLQATPFDEEDCDHGALMTTQEVRRT